MSLSIGIGLSVDSGLPVSNKLELVTPPAVLTQNIKKATIEVSSVSATTSQNNRIYQSLVNEQSININLKLMTEIKAEQISGQQSHEIDYMLALISDDVYIRTTMGIGDYVRLSDEELLKAGIEPKNLRDDTTGFQAGIYRNDDLYIVAFVGTNDLKDILTNLRQGFGFDEAQYHQAVDLARTARMAFGENMLFTGHSLGGGLAATAALSVGKPAVIFNSAGVSDNMMKNLGLSPQEGRNIAENGLIRHYVAEYDLLDTLQQKLPVSQPIGHKILLKYNGDLEESSKWLPSLMRGLNAHSLKKVLELLTIYKPWLSLDDEQQEESLAMLNESAVNVSV
ncbi:phospholipase [Photorhabdus heterorhabditis]|uniref:Phospholipase n=1 Tax=Photorhabdus heterorhabditis TaxID=880156 RepID=A0ABR5KBV7_9GAMM|nr:phospholipase [Photorhabdus heterorhabditis]KOY61857.1 phospholipase [Photorhabdus heterorhabditis]